LHKDQVRDDAEVFCNNNVVQVGQGDEFQSKNKNNTFVNSKLRLSLVRDFVRDGGWGGVVYNTPSHPMQFDF